VSLHPVLAERRSPRAFLPDPVAPEDVEALLEAARWAPSANNLQPWRLVVTHRGTPAFDALAATLSGTNRRWAPSAPLLVLAAAASHRDDGRPVRTAAYDLGQAVAHLTFEATARGLAVHQMAGFDGEAAAQAVGLPGGVEPWTVVAIGRPGPPELLEEDLRARETAPRERRPLREVASDGRFGRPFGAA
jgi:nitroreductase